MNERVAQTQPESGIRRMMYLLTGTALIVGGVLLFAYSADILRWAQNTAADGEALRHTIFTSLAISASLIVVPLLIWRSRVASRQAEEDGYGHDDDEDHR